MTDKDYDALHEEFLEWCDEFNHMSPNGKLNNLNTRQFDSEQMIADIREHLASLEERLEHIHERLCDLEEDYMDEDAEVSPEGGIKVGGTADDDEDSEEEEVSKGKKKFFSDLWTPIEMLDQYNLNPFEGEWFLVLYTEKNPNLSTEVCFAEDDCSTCCLHKGKLCGIPLIYTEYCKDKLWVKPLMPHEW